MKANYLASPPLVVAYALSGRIDVDLTTEPIGQGPGWERRLPPGSSGRAPSRWKETIGRAISEEMYRGTAADVFTGDEHRAALDVPEGDIFAWDPSRPTCAPPYFDGMSQEPGTVEDVAGARCLVMVGDSVTTDHISPAGAIRPDSPAGKYLIEHSVERKDFNSYGSRRGNHEVMVRGTFANVRLRNLLGEGRGNLDGAPSRRRGDDDLRRGHALSRGGRCPSSSPGRSTAPGRRATGRPRARNLLGVRAVIAETYERIHRSNPIGMGIVPLQYPDGESAESLGLTGREEFAVEGLENGEASEVQVSAKPDDGEPVVHRPRAPGHATRARLPAPRRDPALRPAQARGLVLDLHPLDQPSRSVNVADALVSEQLAVARADDLVTSTAKARPPP